MDLSGKKVGDYTDISWHIAKRKIKIMPMNTARPATTPGRIQ